MSRFLFFPVMFPMLRFAFLQMGQYLDQYDIGGIVMCEISTHVTNIYDNNYYFIVTFISYNHVINSARICDYQNRNTLLRGRVTGSCIYM